jgi:hypothetical protein
MSVKLALDQEVVPGELKATLNPRPVTKGIPPIPCFPDHWTKTTVV